MNIRQTHALFTISFTVVSVGLSMPAEGQTAAGDQLEWTVPRLPDGRPDLQGNWSNATVTPLERPATDPSPVLSWDRVAELEGRAASRLEASFEPVDPNRPLLSSTSNPGTYDDFFFDMGDRVAIVNGEPRSSLITVPSHGRIPSLTAHARQRLADEAEFRGQFGEYDHPELRPLPERCLLPFGTGGGPPTLPNYGYNSNYTIVQTAEHVMLLSEMMHDARIIPIIDGPDDKPLVPGHIRPWMGVSWGWWEGDTLVVETTNIDTRQNLSMYLHGEIGASEQRMVREQFTRVDEETILYEFWIDDPMIYTEPWGGQVPMYAFDDLLYEYACHEGNYALESVLRGGRYQDSLQGGSQP